MCILYSLTFSHKIKYGVGLTEGLYKKSVYFVKCCNLSLCVLHFRHVNQELFLRWKTTPEFSTRMACLRTQLAVSGERAPMRSQMLPETSCACLRYVCFYSKSLLLFHVLPFDIIPGHLPQARGTKLFPHPYLLSSWKVLYVNYFCIGFFIKHF